MANKRWAIFRFPGPAVAAENRARACVHAATGMMLEPGEVYKTERSDDVDAMIRSGLVEEVTPDPEPVPGEDEPVKRSARPAAAKPREGQKEG